MSAIAPLPAVTAYHVTIAPESSGNKPRALRDVVAAALTNGERHVVVDCSDWRTLDLRVVSALVQCARACGALGAEFELVNLGEHLRADLDALNLDGRLCYLA